MKKAKMFIASLVLCFVWATSVYGQNQQTHLNPYVFWPVKNSQNMVRVLDSTVYSLYNSTTMGWDKTSKDVVISRHWGTEGWPHELITFRYDQASLSWTPYQYSEFQYFPNHKIKNFLEKRYHTFLHQFRDTTCYVEYSPKVNQLGDSISIKNQNASYDGNSNSIKAGSKDFVDLLNDSQILKITEYHFNTSSATYNIPYSMTTYEYNDQNLISIITDFVWNNLEQMYVNTKKIYYEYTTEKLIKTKITQFFNSGSWHNSEKDEKSYYPNGLLKTLIIYNSDNSNTFVPFSKDSFVYTTFNKESKKISYVWNNATLSWVTQSRSTFIYNAQNLLIQVFNEEWDGTTWSPQSKTVMTYNSQSNLSTWNYYEYDQATSSWINTGRIVDQYDPSGLYLIEEIRYQGNTLKPFYRYTATYDNYNNKQNEITYGWDNGTSSWKPSEKNEYYWSDWDANALNEQDVLLTYIYPNPTNEQVNIITSTPLVKVDIINITGQLIKTKILDNVTHFNLDIADLPQGMYYLRLTSTQHNQIVKAIIKQ